MMTDGELRSLLVRLEAQYGTLRPAGTKPFSVHYRDVNGTIFIKVYRVIDPTARQVREVHALTAAPRLGLRVPRLLDRGHHRNTAWIATSIVPGTPMTISSTADLRRFVTTAKSITAPLHALTVDGAGHGWTGQTTQPSAHCASQLSARLRALPMWPNLRRKLRLLDDLPSVYLHGDLKPDHLIVGANSTHVLDWEACARGPHLLDEADIAFRVAREKAFSHLPEGSTRTVMGSSPSMAAALAWRLTLWLDRRHHKINDELALLFDQITRLADSDTPVRSSEDLIRKARMIGTKY